MNRTKNSFPGSSAGRRRYNLAAMLIGETPTLRDAAVSAVGTSGILPGKVRVLRQALEQLRLCEAGANPRSSGTNVTRAPPRITQRKPHHIPRRGEG
jgi:hypothetical protein